MKIWTPIIFMTTLVLLAITIGNACAMDAISPLSLDIEGMHADMYLDHDLNLVAGSGQPNTAAAQSSPEVNFSRLEEISGLYIEVDKNASTNETIKGRFLLLNSPFYLDDDHLLHSVYGTFSRDLTDNQSRPEYLSDKTGVWQWLENPGDQNQVMIRLGSLHRNWYTLGLVQLYETDYRANVHVTNVVLGGPYKKANLTLLGHNFEKIYV